MIWATVLVILKRKRKLSRWALFTLFSASEASLRSSRAEMPILLKGRWADAGSANNEHDAATRSKASALEEEAICACVHSRELRRTLWEKW